MYHVKDLMTDMMVTEGHRMLVSHITGDGSGGEWNLVPIEDIKDHRLVAYKHDAIWLHKNNDDVDLDVMGVFAHNFDKHRHFPDWVWTLSQFQSHVLVALICKDNSKVFTTRIQRIAYDMMRLALHAGLISFQIGPFEYSEAITISFTSGDEMTHKITPQSRTVSEIEVNDNGLPVYCMRVPGEVFYVRRNGCPVWTGNSRAANGPVVLLTRQPAEGRARDGGLRLGEMEMECLWAHGAMSFLKERFMECSDNYKVFVCKECGMIAHVNPDKSIYHCKACKNITRFSEVRIPYAGKLLMQEIQTMGIATRFITDE
jgi:hypothetical protein